MTDEISRIVHEGGQAKVIEVTFWVDRPGTPQVVPEAKHWIYVGIGTALVADRPLPPGEERRRMDALDDLQKTLAGLGYQFSSRDDAYWFVVTGKTRTDQELIDLDPCGLDDCVIACQTVKVVKTRKEHTCLGMLGAESVHQMPPGTRARYDKALVDGKFGSYYVCADCIEKYMASEDL